MIGRRPGLLRGVQRPEQPAGADDRADTGEQQADDADVSFEVWIGALLLIGGLGRHGGSSRLSTG